MERPDLAELFADTDYAHRLRVSRRHPADFFAEAQCADTETLGARRRQLSDQASRYAPCLPAEALPALRETAGLFGEWGVALEHAGRADDSQALLASLGAATLADLVWLGTGDAAPAPRMVAGAVCFPSAWDPAEKLGLPLAGIHGVVPGLNQELGTALDTFLTRLPPGVAWCRANWGLTASPDLDQHPARQLPRLDAMPRLDQVWVRVEHQALIAQPASGSVLFAIRVEVLALRDLCREPRQAHGLARALASMPEPMARYKGLADARPALVAALEREAGEGAG